MKQITVNNFENWRLQARHLLENKTPPEEILWESGFQQNLFDDSQNPSVIGTDIKVPKEFISLAKAVSCHRDNNKWTLLYRVLWRLIFEEKNLLKISTDADIYKLHTMRKHISRDAHKMKAFVRFREVMGEKNTYVAWHDPSHLIVQYTAPFFARRFAAMKWTILTPNESAYWDGETLRFDEGVPRSKAPNTDEMEEMWKTFYRNIFNPARIKIKMMKSEMPVKYWHTMPETALIPSMLEEADARVKKMLENGVAS